MNSAVSTTELFVDEIILLCKLLKNTQKIQSEWKYTSFKQWNIILTQDPGINTAKKGNKQTSSKCKKTCTNKYIKGIINKN